MTFVPIKTESAAKEADCRKNYNGVDLVKFLCSVMVFIIHIAPFQEESFAFAKCLNFGLQNYACRVAVPFFFVSSGYFLFRKAGLYDLNSEVVESYCFKMFRLLGTWHVLLFVGGKYHLWYLGGTIVAVILLSLCLRLRVKRKYIYLLGFLLYFVGLLGDSYYGFVESFRNIKIVDYIIKGYAYFFYETKNGLFMGFIYVLMGATFAWTEIKIPYKTALFAFAASMICLFGEVFFLECYSNPRDYNMYVFLLPAVFFLFYLACNIQLRDRPLFKQLRIVGVLIYFLHLLLDNVAGLGITLIRKFCGVDFAQYQFVFALLLTVGFAAFLAWLSNRDRFRWLRFLYS